MTSAKLPLAKYKIQLDCSVEFTVLAESAEEAVNYYRRADNLVLYYLVKGKYCEPPQNPDMAEVISDVEVDQGSVEAERIR